MVLKGSFPRNELTQKGYFILRVAIIDSFPAFQKVIGREVEQQTDMQLVGTSNCGSEALTLVREQSPDVIILGVNRDSPIDAYDPVEVVKNLRQEYPSLRVIMLSNEAIYVRELIDDGATYRQHWMDICTIQARPPPR